MPTKIITARTGRYKILYDKCDRDIIESRKWYVCKFGKSWYLVVKSANVSLSRAIMKPEAPLCVDHRNGNTLDNRRCNLRVCTHAENMRNRKASRGRALPKGVHFRKNGYEAYIRVNTKLVYIGRFKTEPEATAAYNEAAKQYHGEYARINEAL
jgi:hypothetical protein